MKKKNITDYKQPMNEEYNILKIQSYRPIADCCYFIDKKNFYSNG